MMNRRSVKKILAQLPYTVELYWHLVQRHKPWQAHFNLDLLESVLPDAVQQAENASPAASGVFFIFASLHYWIEYAALLGVALAGRGHQVNLSFCLMPPGISPLKNLTCGGKTCMPARCSAQRAACCRCNPCWMCALFKAIAAELEQLWMRSASF
jgi:hypothetical protein